MMREDHKKWIKKIGIAGFLFFLIKGLLWLFLGVQFLSIFIIILSASTLNAQFKSVEKMDNIFLHKFEFINKVHLVSDIIYKPGFFCKLEDKIPNTAPLKLNFSLGSLDYTNYLEYYTYKLNPSNKQYFRQ